jgi:hypothetical protein
MQMDDHRFDNLARHVASAAATRRSAIKALLGAITGGALTLAGNRGSEAAACRPIGSVCREHANCCVKSCLPASLFQDRRARCGCPDQLTPCGNECVDLNSDPQHCGKCGIVAETDRNETCCGGVITQLGTNANCAFCGDNCTNRGEAFHCAIGSSGLFCTDAPCPPQPTSTGTVTPTAPSPITGLCTILNTVTVT